MSDFFKRQAIVRLGNALGKKSKPETDWKSLSLKLGQQNNELEVQLNETKCELESLHNLAVRQSDILTAVVNALKVDPPDLTTWSHHDAAEVARNVVQQLETLKRDLSEKAEAHSRALRDVSDSLDGYENRRVETEQQTDSDLVQDAGLTVADFVLLLEKVTTASQLRCTVQYIDACNRDETVLQGDEWLEVEAAGRAALKRIEAAADPSQKALDELAKQAQEDGFYDNDKN